MANVQVSPQGYHYGAEPLSQNPFWGTGDGEVTGVKGARELNYRTGDVTLTAPNIFRMGDGLEYDPSDETVRVTGLNTSELVTLISIITRG